MLFASPMIGVPPICQSADGNGGESNGAGGIRRCCGDALGAGTSYAGERKSSANVANNRVPNQSAFSAAAAVEITIPAAIPTAFSLNQNSFDSNKASIARWSR
jgi:hypothetical protein